MKTIEDVFSHFVALTQLEKKDLHEWCYLNGIEEFDRVIEAGTVAKELGENYSKKLKAI